MYQAKSLRLRAIEREDLSLMHAFVNDYQTMRGAFAGMLYPSSFEDESRYLEGQSSYTHGEYQFAIELNDGTLIGRCGFIKVDWKNRTAEMAILIGDKAARGKGFGAEAVDTLCRFGFQELNLHRIKASVFSFNEPALHCYKKCGFEEEGCLREELFREGKYHDVILLARINR